MHSGSMRTARSLPYGGFLSGGVSVRKTLYPLDRQTPVKILPCPKLRLRAVKSVVMVLLLFPFNVFYRYRCQWLE